MCGSPATLIRLSFIDRPLRSSRVARGGERDGSPVDTCQTAACVPVWRRTPRAVPLWRSGAGIRMGVECGVVSAWRDLWPPEPGGRGQSRPQSRLTRPPVTLQAQRAAEARRRLQAVSVVCSPTNTASHTRNHIEILKLCFKTRSHISWI